LHTHRIALRNVNWLGEQPIAANGEHLAVRVRSTTAPQPATLFPSADGGAKVLLHDGEYGIAAGQACVFYADIGSEARVLGGGWIGSTMSRADTEATVQPATLMREQTFAERSAVERETSW
jgi:tRNA-specific 2-thiouridylase